MCRCIASKGLNTSHIKKHTFDSPVAHSVLWHEECSLPWVSVCSFSQATLQWNQSNATSDMHSTAQMHRAHLVSELIARWKQENFLWSKALNSQNLGERMAGLLDDCYRSWTGFPRKIRKHASKRNTGHAQSWYSKHTLLIKFQTHRETNEDHVNQFAAGPGKRASYLDYQRAEEKLVTNGNILGWRHVFPPEC